MPAEWTDAELEQLSAYIDQQLDESDRTALEARLVQDADLRQELAAMRQTAALLRSLPTIRAPRAFTLTLDMLGQTAVPAMALSESARVIPMPQARPARRVWWIPAASAAGVVLLAGAFLLTQVNPGGAPAGVVQNSQGVAQLSTSAPTQTQDLTTYNVIGQAVYTAQPTETAVLETQEMKVNEQPPSLIPPNLASTGKAQATQTDLVIPAPMQGASPIEPPTSLAADNVQRDFPTETQLADGTQPMEAAAQGSTITLPAAVPSSEPPTTVLAGVSSAGVPIPAPTEALLDEQPRFSPTGTLVSESIESANSSDAATGPNFDMPSGGGAVAGMEGLNPDPNAPGFTVSTMSPPQGTAIAQYNAPVDDQAGMPASAQSAAPQGASRSSGSILSRWLNTLTAWLNLILGRE